VPGLNFFGNHRQLIVITYIVIAMKTIAEEIKQKKPFSSLEEEVHLALLRTADAVSSSAAALFKTHGISPTQYNVLRILRGAGTQGLRCSEIGDRMITHDPDITRLLDRLEKAGLIVRTRSEQDRRVVLTSITNAGLELLRELDRPVIDLQKKMLGHMGERKLRSLISLLDEARDNS
jgi:MarR family transcriptional regulator, organic hydroperoxide resistance regulator